MPSLLVRRIAARHQIRQAAREACQSRSFRQRSAALQSFTPEVVEAFGQHFTTRLAAGHITAAGVLKKLQNLVRVFAKAPQLWINLKEHFARDFPGAPEFRGLRDIPALIRWLPKVLDHLVRQGAKLLGKAVEKAFSHLPLSLFTAGERRLLTMNDILNRILAFLKDNAPAAFKRLASKTGAYVKSHVLPSIGAWAQENIPTFLHVGTKAFSLLEKALNHPVILWAVYWYIWSNVTEFEWDAKALGNAATGNLTFRELWASLPGAAFGRLLSLLFSPGTFSLLPYVIAIRLLYCLGAHYLEWNGGQIVPDWQRMGKSFGVDPMALQQYAFGSSG